MELNYNGYTSFVLILYNFLNKGLLQRKSENSIRVDFSLKLGRLTNFVIYKLLSIHVKFLAFGDPLLI